MWMAPRGIVAAAVTSVFALELAEKAGYVEAELMVPEMFLVIVGTVTIYGLTAAPLGRWLNVAKPNPQGTLIVGAHHWARLIGAALQESGFKVLLIDNNHEHVTAAKMSGLPAVYANVLAEAIHHELDLGAFGRLLALTPNDEVNALATLHFAEIFGRASVYQVYPKETQAALQEFVPMPLRGRLLFSADITCQKLTAALKKEQSLKRQPSPNNLATAIFKKSTAYRPSRSF